ncbi:hypothetical protein [Rhizobium sp. F40D2]|uniref:hypothetical protein n=1 Tax=Rhizobium sp. F40D2 TaxID=3453141 RepID=UPI003F24F259
MAKLLGELWMGCSAGDHINKKEDHTLTIAIGDLTPGAGRVQGPFTNAGGGDQSQLAPGDIPDGIFIECEGSDTNGWGWAVLRPWSQQPIFTATDFDAHYVPRSLRLALGLYLHCDNPFAGGGNVRVKVYAA